MTMARPRGELTLASRPTDARDTREVPVLPRDGDPFYRWPPAVRELVVEYLDAMNREEQR